eukprot:bmy_01489T0
MPLPASGALGAVCLFPPRLAVVGAVLPGPSPKGLDRLPLCRFVHFAFVTSGCLSTSTTPVTTPHICRLAPSSSPSGGGPPCCPNFSPGMKGEEGFARPLLRRGSGGLCSRRARRVGVKRRSVRLCPCPGAAVTGTGMRMGSEEPRGPWTSRCEPAVASGWERASHTAGGDPVRGGPRPEQGPKMGTPPAGRTADVMLCALAPHRSQELHLRPESHSYLPELGKSEMEFLESKRPRLELLPDPLLRPSPLLATGQPGGSEDLSKGVLAPKAFCPQPLFLLCSSPSLLSPGGRSEVGRRVVSYSRVLGVWRDWESRRQLAHVSDGNDEARVIPRHWGPVGFGGDRSLTGKLEPVSPPSPPHADPELELVPPRLSKEELIQNMDRVDREITMVEQQISKLKKKQPRCAGVPPSRPGAGGAASPSACWRAHHSTLPARSPQQQLEEEAAKPPEPEKPVSPPPIESKHRSLVQIIYDENRTCGLVWTVAGLWDANENAGIRS